MPTAAFATSIVVLFLNVATRVKMVLILQRAGLRSCACVPAGGGLREDGLRQV